LPTLQKKHRALDYDNLDKTLKAHLTSNMDTCYGEISIPKSSEWLWEHKETGQTYKSYITGMINSPSKSHNTVYIKNLDSGLSDSFLTDDMLEHLRLLIEIYYPGVKAKFMTDDSNFESLGIKKRMNGYLQYHAGEAIEKISKLIPKDGIIVIGLTAYDLYPREEWNFVFGLADKLSGCGIFSFRRYHDELAESFQGDENISFIDFITKLAGKIMLHETGHLFGLSHCIYFKCLMNGSNHLQENLSKPFEICPVCLRKIVGNLKCDVIRRFEGLAEGLTRINATLYEEEIKWYTDRITYLNTVTI
jgi:archaemetzincin